MSKKEHVWKEGDRVSFVDVIGKSHEGNVCQVCEDGDIRIWDDPACKPFMFNPDGNKPIDLQSAKDLKWLADHPKNGWMPH